MATKITTRSSRGRRFLLASLWLGSFAATGCSIPGLLARNAHGIGQASQAMRATTLSVQGTNQNLQTLEPTLLRVAALGPELEQLSALRSELAEIALLREDLTSISRMGGQLERIATLDARLAQLTALAPALEQLSAMREPIEQLKVVVARTEQLELPLTAAADLEPSLRELQHGVRRLSAPLDQTSASLSRLLRLIDDNTWLWLLGLGLVVWLAGTCAAVALGVVLGARALKPAGNREHVFEAKPHST